MHSHSRPVQNIRAHLFMDHGWNEPFASRPDRELHAYHDSLHASDER